jgi:hypothetical protein
MNYLSSQATEPDLALVYLASFFETLDCTPPPERDEAKLDALACLILDKRPKTLLGLAIRARAERQLCRYLWTVDFEKLPPSDQAARVVIERAMQLARRPSHLEEKTNEPRPANSKTPPRGDRSGAWCSGQEGDATSPSPERSRLPDARLRSHHRSFPHGVRPAARDLSGKQHRAYRAWI